MTNKSWTEAETKALWTAFDQANSVSKLAQKFNCTAAEVDAQLKKTGKRIMHSILGSTIANPFR